MSIQSVSNSLLAWNHYTVVAPPAGFMSVSGALNGALSDVGNLFMAIGTFIWNVASWFFNIAINPAFIVNPLIQDLSPVYKGAYTHFFLPLLPLFGLGVLAFAIFHYFRGNYTHVFRVLASSLLSVLLIVTFYVEFPFLFRVVDDLALQTTSSVMALLESTLSSGQITSATQPVNGLLTTYLTEPWELMQFGFLLPNATDYELQGGTSGQTFQTLLSNLGQTDTTWSQPVTVGGVKYSSLLQYAFSVPYPTQVTLPSSTATKQVLNPQYKTDPHAPKWITVPSSSVTITGLGTATGTGTFPDWRNVFYAFSGQEQQTAIANSFFVKGQQTVTGASIAPNSNGSLDENHFFSGSGNVALILLTALLSLVPLAFTLYTGFQLLMRELQFFFKLGQGVISIPFLMIPEGGPTHTKKWLQQSLGHLVERFGVGVYFAIAVGLGSLFENLISGMISGNPELSMMLSMLFLAVWYLGAFIYREKLFDLSIHPLANAIGGSQNIAGRNYTNRIAHRQQLQKTANDRLAETQKEHEIEKKKDEQEPKRGNRAKNLRAIQTENGSAPFVHSQLPSDHEDLSLVPPQENPLVGVAVEAHRPAVSFRDAVSWVQNASDVSEESLQQRFGATPEQARAVFQNLNRQGFVVPNRLNQQNVAATQEKSASPSYGDARSWVLQQRSGITHLGLKRATGADEKTTSQWMKRLTDENLLERDGTMWRAVASSQPKLENETSEPLPTETALRQGSVNADESLPIDVERALPFVTRQKATTSFLLSRQLGVDQHQAETVMDRLQEMRIVKHGVGAWMVPVSRAEGENPLESEAGTLVTAPLPESEQPTALPEPQEPVTVPLPEPEEPSTVLPESNEQATTSLAEPQEPVTPLLPKPIEAPTPTRVAPPAESSVITPQQVGRVKQFTRKLGTGTRQVVHSQPVTFASNATEFVTKKGAFVTKGALRDTAKLTLWGGKITARALEWHADSLGNSSREGVVQGFQNHMLKLSRTEQRIGLAAQTAHRHQQAMGKLAKRMPGITQSEKALQRIGQKASEQIKSIAKDWFSESNR